MTRVVTETAVSKWLLIGAGAEAYVVSAEEDTAAAADDNVAAVVTELLRSAVADSPRVHQCCVPPS